MKSLLSQFITKNVFSGHGNCLRWVSSVKLIISYIAEYILHRLNKIHVEEFSNYLVCDGDILEHQAGAVYRTGIVCFATYKIRHLIVNDQSRDHNL